MSNQMTNNKEPLFDCPEFWGEDDAKDIYCGTPYCYGASFFSPEWLKDHWEVGWSCGCGCANRIYVCYDEEEGWEET